MIDFWKRGVAVLIIICMTAGMLLSVTANGKTTVPGVLLEAESMDISGHAIAEKTETSVKATYANGTGDDWLAHGGYVNYTVTEDECLYVKARTLALSESTRQFSVRYTYTADGKTYQEYFFHFPGSEFDTANEYIEIPLYDKNLIGAKVTEIALFGNAADRAPFEVDCFLIGQAITEPTENVLFEAENMNVVDIAVKTSNSLIANYAKSTSNEWLAWGAYVSYKINSVDEEIVLRARLLEESDSSNVVTVKFNLSDGTEGYFPFGVESFGKVNEYCDLVIPIDKINGKTIREIALFGNLTDRVKIEIDCFLTRKAHFDGCYGSDAEILNDSAAKIDGRNAVISSNGDTVCLKFNPEGTFNNRTSQLAVTSAVKAGNEGSLIFKYYDARGGEIGRSQTINTASFKNIGEEETLLLFLQEPANPYYECDYVTVEAVGNAIFSIHALCIVGNTGVAGDIEADYCVECENLTSPVGFAMGNVLNASVDNGTGCLFWGMYLPKNMITVPGSKKLVVYARLASKPSLNVTVAKIENLVDARSIEWTMDIKSDMFPKAGVYYPIEFTVNSCNFPEASNEIRMWYNGYTDISIDKILIMDVDKTPPAPDSFVGRFIKLPAAKYAVGNYDVVSDGVAALEGDPSGSIFDASTDFADLGDWRVKKSVVAVIKAYSLPENEQTVLAEIKIGGKTIGKIKAGDFSAEDTYQNLAFPFEEESGRITVEYKNKAGIKLNTVYAVRDADIGDIPKYLDKLTFTASSDLSSTSGINDRNTITAFSDMVDSGEQIFLVNYYASISKTNLDKFTANSKKAVLYVKILKKSGTSQPILTLDILGTAFRKNIYESDFAKTNTYYALEFPIDSAMPVGENNYFRLIYAGYSDIQFEKLIVMDKNAISPKAENIALPEPVRPSDAQVVERASAQISNSVFEISEDILGEPTAVINNERLSFMVMRHMPSTVKFISGVYLKSGECELRSFIRQERKSNRFSDTVLDIIVYENRNGISYPIDDLTLPLWMAYNYYKLTDDASVFDENFRLSLVKTIELFEIEQHHRERSEFRFVRLNCEPEDTLINNGIGAEIGYTGMVWSAFLPSDAAAKYGYLIASNLLATVVLGFMYEICNEFWKDSVLAQRIITLKTQIYNGVMKYGVVEHPEYGKIFAYDTDGFGNYQLLDDALIPNLVSLPYFKAVDYDDEIYCNTRRFVLSKSNPNYLVGKAARGMASVHIPGNFIWPLAMVMQAMTSCDINEVDDILHMLETTDNGTYMMHETINTDDPSVYSWDEFCMPSALFCELLYKYANKKLPAFRKVD